MVPIPRCSAMSRDTSESKFCMMEGLVSIKEPHLFASKVSKRSFGSEPVLIG